MNVHFSLEELAEQFLERRQNGELLEAEDFAAAHPEYAEQLRQILPLMLDMEKIRPDHSLKINSSPVLPTRTNLPDSDYRLLRKLGSGGMGTVFEAIQISLNRKVAVKLLNSSLLSNAEQREQFENEAKVIAMLHHPNIVKIYSAGCSEERCYYAMELIEGKGLDQCTFDNLRDLAKIGLQAAEALAYAHRCGVLHRDIKPANMLLDAAGNIHISDFGISFILKGNKSVIETGGSRSGTLRYMAPERLAKGINTFATDQYSFGATLYELVSGKPILQEESREALQHRICTEPVPPLICREPELAAIINKSICFHPELRYSNMEELASDLKRFLNHEPVRAANSSLRHRFVLWCRRKPAIAALTFAALFCAAAFIVSLTIGFIRTRTAFRLAQQNAAAADSTLSQVFSRISEQPPSQKNTRLLSALLPYYQMIARQRNIPDSKICSAYEVIGECAMRAGSYTLAENAFRQMMKYRSDAYPINQLAAVLKKQGRTQESEKLSREVVSRFEKSNRAMDRFETVRALLALSETPNSKERSQAFPILESLLKEHPDNPSYRFLYAVLLGGNPRLYRSMRIPGVEPNAGKLLAQLAEAYPEQPEYSLALVELMLRRFRFVHSFQNNHSAAEEAVFVSERMLGRWPNDPQIVSAVVKLHSRYIDLLRRHGSDSRARKENERLLSILEILFHHPDISDTVKEELIQLQLKRLKILRQLRGSEDTETLRKKIDRELEYYHGPQREKFRKELAEISST